MASGPGPNTRECIRCGYTDSRWQVLQHCLYDELTEREVPYSCRDCVFRATHRGKAWQHRANVHNDPAYARLEDTCSGTFEDLPWHHLMKAPVVRCNSASNLPGLAPETEVGCNPASNLPGLAPETEVGENPRTTSTPQTLASAFVLERISTSDIDSETLSDGDSETNQLYKELMAGAEKVTSSEPVTTLREAPQDGVQPQKVPPLRLKTPRHNAVPSDSDSDSDGLDIDVESDDTSVRSTSWKRKDRSPSTPDGRRPRKQKRPRMMASRPLQRIAPATLPPMTETWMTTASPLVSHVPCPPAPTGPANRIPFLPMTTGLGPTPVIRPAANLDSTCPLMPQVLAELRAMHQIQSNTLAALQETNKRLGQIAEFARVQIQIQNSSHLGQSAIFKNLHWVTVQDPPRASTSKTTSTKATPNNRVL